MMPAIQLRRLRLLPLAQDSDEEGWRLRGGKATNGRDGRFATQAHAQSQVYDATERQTEDSAANEADTASPAKIGCDMACSSQSSDESDEDDRLFDAGYWCGAEVTFLCGTARRSPPG